MPRRTRIAPRMAPDFLRATARATRIPKGKGIFVRALSHTGTPTQMVDRCRWAGLTWAAIQILWQHPDHDKILNLDELSSYASALRAAGIDVWIWGYPEVEGSRQLTFVTTMANAVARANAEGIILDVEAPWRGVSDSTAAALIKRVRMTSPGRQIGVTSYGNVLGFDDMPWEGLSIADMGIPQVYHGYETLGIEYQAEAVAAYKAVGFAAVVPALAAYDVSVSRLLELYRYTPQPDGAVIWWDWYTATKHGTWSGIRSAGSLARMRRRLLAT